MILSPEQHAKRKGRLTGSRIGVLMTGDIEGILQLYRELIGEAVEEDMTNVWPVQLGACTEGLNLDWYERRQRNEVTRRGEVVISPEFDWAACTLDGWDAALRCPIECKHIGGREPIERVVERYQPQMQWAMMVTGAKTCAFSVIVGANEPTVDYVDRDDAYITEMVSRAEGFMLCVALRRPPVELPAAPPPGDPTKIINMTGNNEWAFHAGVFIDCQEAADSYDDSKGVLKKLMPADAKRAFGHGVYVLRDRAGRLHVRGEKEKGK